MESFANEWLVLLVALGATSFLFQTMSTVVGRDINRLSSQQPYTALGGRNFHCFLHDRRMCGRDLAAGRGAGGVLSPALSLPLALRLWIR